MAILSSSSEASLHRRQTWKVVAASGAQRASSHSLSREAAGSRVYSTRSAKEASSAMERTCMAASTLRRETSHQDRESISNQAGRTRS